MNKFTTEHFNRLKEIIVDYVLGNKVITNQMGKPLDITVLIHSVSINGLNSLKQDLEKKREKTINAWTEDTDSIYDEQIELLDLIIGYKVTLNNVKKQNEEVKQLVNQIAELERYGDYRWLYTIINSVSF